MPPERLMINHLTHSMVLFCSSHIHKKTIPKVLCDPMQLKAESEEIGMDCQPFSCFYVKIVIP